jgi:tetratricopeptide (TPR) repeat protein
MTANAEAYALFVQGRDLARRFGTENKRTSIRLLEQATRADPDFALAWAWLGASKLLLAIPETPRNARALVREARVAVSRALLIDPNLSMGHYVQATLHDHDLDFAGSMASIERAYAADPNQPFILIRRGEYYALIGQIDKAQAMIEEGLARDPTDAAGLVKLAQIRMIKGDFESARQLSQRSLELGFEPAGGFVCTSLYALDKVREAVDCWVRLPAVMKARYEPVFSGDAMWAGIGRAVFAGDEQARRSVLESLRLHFARPDPKVNTYLMQLHMGLRAPELFMKRFVDFPYNGNASVMPALWMGGDAALVRTNPAFPAFAERIGLIRAWERYGWPDKCRKTGRTADGSIAFACA